MKKRVVFIYFLGCIPAACASASSPADVAGDIPGDGIEAAESADVTADDVPEEAGCPPGQTECGGVCVNTVTDHANCGGCGSACRPAEVCAGGVCLFECPGGTIACEGSCVDTNTDVGNCGGCGTACRAGLHAEAVCEMGLCAVICEAGWSDPDGDGSCDVGCTPSATSETCNGIDDNCDGNIDEGFPCRMGREVGCTTSCGSTGTGVCGLTCQIPAPASCTPPAEACNGQDDDCDGECENTFECCRGEAMNCTTSCGTAGSLVCSALCSWSECIPPDESCNGVDDDCDGSPDDGFECPGGATGPCVTSCGTGGSRTCSSVCTWGACNPPAEACNGTDDDCDGTCDDGFGCCRSTSGPCTTSCSTTGMKVCNASCSWDSCTPPAETCNGTDDNCNGTCDDGFACCRGSSGPCTTSCGSTGTHTCSSSCSWGSCSPPAETCNGVDDNCDGTIDEGFRAANFSSSYTHMSTIQSPCDGTSDRCGIYCKSAINRDCRSMGCYTSGFGPAENTGDYLEISCVAAADLIDTTYTALHAYHSGCSSATVVSGACYAAAHRYCQAAGYVSGFGPVETSGNNCSITCVRGATVIVTTYTELSSHHGSCDGTTERWGCACNAAIKRYCQSSGTTSGFGPVENSGDTAVVVCTFP